MRWLLLGVLLGLLIAFPSLLAVVAAVVGWVLAQPPVLAFAAGVLAWPRIVRRVRRWAK